MNVLITGLGRHGKDSLCEILRDQYGYKFVSSSFFAAKEFIFDRLKDINGYETVEDCFNDRHSGNNRAMWHDLICEYNKENKARLAKRIMQDNDIYCGMRCINELNECKRQSVFDITVWVDATERVGITEGPESISITKEDCDIIVYNNGPEHLLSEVALKLHRGFLRL